MKILIICLTIIVSIQLCNGWGYRGEHGPDHWADQPGNSACEGHKQSPIDIKPLRTRYKQFAPFVMQGYNVFDKASTRPVSIINNAHTVQVNLNGDYLLSGGGLPSTFKAVQFHLHWGSNDTIGSEHTKDGEHYPAEMHIVHYDAVKYASIKEAISQPDGLAVLGFWIKIGKRKPEWSPFIRHLRQVKYAHHPYQFKKPYVLSSLLPTSDFSKFYRYNGSLTTPGCYESVIWTVFADEIEISRKQLKYLRELTVLDAPIRDTTHQIEDQTNHGATHGLSGHGPGSKPQNQNEAPKLQDNFRPIQDLWDRKVYQSWPRDSDMNVLSTLPLNNEPNTRNGHQDANDIIRSNHSRTDIDSLRRENNNLRIENNILRITNNNLLIENNNLRTANEHLSQALIQYDPRKCQNATKADATAQQGNQPSTLNTLSRGTHQ